jgi:hypothetical protein
MDCLAAEVDRASTSTWHGSPFELVNATWRPSRCWPGPRAHERAAEVALSSED